MIFRSGVFSSFSAAYSEVVLPDPVGPVTRMIPLGRWISPLDLLVVVVGEAQLPQAHLDAVLVQDPHHHRLAVTGGDHADAQVQLLLAHGDLDPPVLGSPAFGDVEFRENLDAGEDRAEQPSRGAVALHQHAVDPVADPDAVLERLDVDVRGPQLAPPR